MAIKKLQNNFTTPEQSKRLLELGVPADSADCYRREIEGSLSRIYERWTGAELHRNFFMHIPNVHPCWSVGQLIKILHITYKQDWREYVYLCAKETCSKGLINQIMLYLQKYHKDHDFSKLEE